MSKRFGVGRRHYFTTDEIRAVHDLGTRKGWAVHNGCTFVWLKYKYRRRIFHKMGVGWFYFPADLPLPRAECQVSF